MNEALAELLRQAIAHHQSGEFAAARVLYNRLLDISPPPLDALHLLGVTYLQTNEPQVAENYFRQVLDREAEHPDCLSNLSVALKRQGKLKEAVVTAQRLADLAPSHIDGRINLANILLEAGYPEQALAEHAWLVEHRPDRIAALCEQAQAQRLAGKIVESIGTAMQACREDPEASQAHFEVAQGFFRVGRLDAAIASFQKTVALSPSNVAAQNNLANAYLAQGRTSEAQRAYEEALKYHPTSPELWNNLGTLLRKNNDAEAAVHCFERALECEPGFAAAQANLLEDYMRLCAWDEISKLSIDVDNQTAQELYHGQRPSEQPFLSIARTPDGRVNLHIARSWAKFIEDETKLRGEAFEHWEKGSVPKLRIGYLSADFRNHPVAHVFRAFLQHHDRERFEIILYSYGGDDGSDYARECRALADRFVDLSGTSVVDSARRIHDDRIHVLVDLMGHTKANRMAILSLRPAPVQACYLGYASTTGADFIDYLIADETVAPRTSAACFTETLAYLPDCYHPIDSTPFEHIPAYSRSDFELPENAKVLMSLNQSMKLEPVMFERWLNIMKRVPNSVLWLADMKPKAKTNILEFTRRHGLEESRIMFAPRVDTKAQHLRRLQLADLYLDPRIYNGHTTACDALVAGVPVLALEGPHFASRVSSSSLRAAGLPSLITYSLDAYEARAVELLNSPALLEELRAELKQNKMHQPLFQPEQLVRHIERLYEQMWIHYCLLQSPDFIRA